MSFVVLKFASSGSNTNQQRFNPYNKPDTYNENANMKHSTQNTKTENENVNHVSTNEEEYDYVFNVTGNNSQYSNEIKCLLGGVENVMVEFYILDRFLKYFKRKKSEG